MAFAELRGPGSSLAALALCGALCGAPAAPAEAQAEPLLSAPSEYTDVIDAFDGDDPFDLQVKIEFRSTFRSGLIQREVIDEETGRSSNDARFRDVLDHSGVRNELQLGLEVGVWRDLMVFVGLPIVLSDDEEVALAGGGTCEPGEGACEELLEPSADGTGRELLFEPNPRVVSEQRSGLPRVDLGVAFGLFNQFRGADATWVLRATLAVPTSEPRTACIAGGDDCAPGLSDGSLWLTLESRWSRRYRYVEPLLGISHRFGWVTAGEEVFSSDLGSGADDLPTTTEASAGAALVPWEDRMRHQRFSIELLGRAAYISKGRGFSALFDALGTSGHDQLNTPGASAGERFTGITTIGAHGRLGADLMLVMKAARYVRFTLGAELGVLTSHLLTGAQDCAAGDRRTIEPTIASACRESLVSPLYRPVIDAPGQRFRLIDATSIGLIARAQGQF